MIRRYSILFGIIVSAALLFVVASTYPNEPPSGKKPSDYNMKNNCRDNMYSNATINESGNLSEPWAIGGMFFIFSPWQVHDKK